MFNSPDYIGEVHVKDESKPDEVAKLVAGDVLHIDHGSLNSASSPNKARGKNKIIQIAYLMDTDSTLCHSVWCLLLSIAPPPRGLHS